MLYVPFYAGAWPINLFNALLFIAAILVPIRVGLNRRFLQAVVFKVLFDFGFLFAVGAVIATGRSTLFVEGLPTTPGLLVHFALCVCVVLTAAGFAELLHDLRTKMHRWRLLTD